MPFVPVTERNQARTVGLNGQIKIGRGPSTEFKEYDIKSFDWSKMWDNQDKTGSFGEGYKDAETGPISFDFSCELHNHVDDPVDLMDDDNKYYIEATVDGHGVLTGYFRLKSNKIAANVTADHTISITAQSVIGRTVSGETVTYIKPIWTPYTPA